MSDRVERVENSFLILQGKLNDNFFEWEVTFRLKLKSVVLHEVCMLQCELSDRDHLIVLILDMYVCQTYFD